jgi:hypothetical protein
MPPPRAPTVGGASCLAHSSDLHQILASDHRKTLQVRTL